MIISRQRAISQLQRQIQERRRRRYVPERTLSEIGLLSSRRFSTCHLLPERLSAANSVVTHAATLLSSFLPSFPFLFFPTHNEDTFRTKVRASSLRLPLSFLLPCERSRARASSRSRSIRRVSAEFQRENMKKYERTNERIRALHFRFRRRAGHARTANIRRSRWRRCEFARGRGPGERFSVVEIAGNSSNQRT